MAPPKSRKERAQETHDRLITTAVSLFSERHYEEVSVSDIARNAGVAHGVIFHHFGNKRGIYLAAMERAARKLDMLERIQPGLPLGQQLLQLLTYHLEFLSTHEGLALRLVLGGRGSDPEAWELFEQGRWRIVEWWCEQLGLDPQSPAVRMIMRANIGAMDEATVYWLNAGRPYAVETMAHALADMAARGLSSITVLDPNIDIPAALAKVARRDTGNP